jgi:carbonic anhydrase
MQTRSSWEHKEGEDGHGWDHAGWSYDGPTGPQYWGTLTPDYAQCSSGGRQSPIDIIEFRTSRRFLGDLKFTYPTNASGTLWNNGHTIEFHSETNLWSHISGGPLYEDQYHIVSMHLHAPSEHQLNGKYYPLELHIVHQARGTMDLVVVAVFFEEGPYSEFLAEYEYPIHDIETPDAHSPVGGIDVMSVIPRNASYYYYRGSLTIPDCDERVTWLVLSHTMTALPEQIQEFTKIYPHINRPVQPLNSRVVYFHAEGDPSLLPPNFHIPAPVECPPNVTITVPERDDPPEHHVLGISLVFFCLIALMVSLRAVRPK